ncbi:MAG TPA: transcriptional repressor [Roseiflexaceae bacterium]|nr:transcriptional repressor [Roseiflexaceae bacterium]
MSDIRTELDGLLSKLEAAGRKVTPQRVAVCMALLAHNGHPTTGQIWKAVHDAHPSISQATVYNTIATLEELRLIKRLEIAGDEHTHYDMDLAPHVNAVCKRCGRIEDVYTDTLEALLGLVAARSGYALDPHEGMIVYGLCRVCRKAAGGI